MQTDSGLHRYSAGGVVRVSELVGFLNAFRYRNATKTSSNEYVSRFFVRSHVYAEIIIFSDGSYPYVGCVLTGLLQR